MDTLFNNVDHLTTAGETTSEDRIPGQGAGLPPKKPGFKSWSASLLVLALVAGAVIMGPETLFPPAPAAPAPLPPSVSVSFPIERDLAPRLEFLGQFSATEKVEMRAQVGGTLTRIGFRDAAVVHKGDLLFEIDPTPYEIKLSSAKAQLEAAEGRLDLANRQFVRADTLKKSGFGSVEVADQRAAEQRAAQGAIEEARAAIRDAQFDLDHTRIVAPFTGRIGSHQVSVGNLISGSRAGAGPSTLLATLVSTDQIYLNFDMSEADYMSFLRARAKQSGPLADEAQIALADEKTFDHRGTFDFVDNTLDRASGVIHARATVANADGLLTPGGFARLRFEVSKPTPALLVPDASVLPDQSDHIVLTVGANNVVTPKPVQLGDLRDGLRVIRSGLAPSDRVIVHGVPAAHPGATVEPHVEAITAVSNSTEG